MTTNWAGNYRYGVARVETPASVEQVQEIVAAHPRIVAMGTGHSFQGIADRADGVGLSLSRLPQVFGIDSVRRTVTVPAGASYGQIARALEDRGLALANLASLPHISAAGAVATATHGSGDALGTLSSEVVGLEIVNSEGERERFDRESHPDVFDGLVVGLGALGVVTSLTLRLVDSYQVAQTVYADLPRSAFDESFDEITASGYSVSLFTDWRTRDFTQVWVKSHGDAPGGDAFFGASRASVQLHPVPGMSAENTTLQGGVPGPWFDRLPHFRIGFTPSNGSEIQSEYLVPRQRAREALASLEPLSAEIAALVQICEIRTIAADSLWLSSAYETDAVGLHFTWRPDQAAVDALIPRMEDLLSPWRARPHWGKAFAMGARDIRALYPRLGDFVRLAESRDPVGKFRNEFLETHVFDA